MTNDDWQALIPEVGLRQQQFDALRRVWGYYEDGAEVVMLEAPTGVGKSIIQLALLRKTAQDGGNGFVVTTQRALQDQMKEWSDVAVMKGRGTFECLLSDSSAAAAPCTTMPEVRQTNAECGIGRCPFYTALDRAQKSRITIHNYASIMAQAYIGEHFSQRTLLCLDEAHTAADWVRNFLTFEFTRDALAELTTDDPPTKPEPFIEWFQALVATLTSIPTGLSDELKVTMLRVMAVRSHFQNVPWAVVYDNYEDTWTVVPIKVAPVAWLLTGLGQRLLLTSATILHTRLMAAELGLGKRDVKSVVLDSAFPVENRPIIKRYCGSMAFKSKGKTLRPLLEELTRIANRHRHEAGLIHTVSHALAKDVTASLMMSDPTRVIHQLPSGPERDATIREFVNGGMGPNAILVAASLLEGFDGKDDIARWQVMTKVPWPSMSSPVVKHQMSLTGESGKIARAWYNWKTAQACVQGFGRVVRTPTDHGVTYLLDSTFQKVLDGGYVPGYVRDAIR